MKKMCFSKAEGDKNQEKMNTERSLCSVKVYCCELYGVTLTQIVWKLWEENNKLELSCAKLRTSYNSAYLRFNGY